jgi:hypothetical protein
VAVDSRRDIEYESAKVIVIAHWASVGHEPKCEIDTRKAFQVSSSTLIGLTAINATFEFMAANGRSEVSRLVPTRRFARPFIARVASSTFADIADQPRCTFTAVEQIGSSLNGTADARSLELFFSSIYEAELESNLDSEN